MEDKKIFEVRNLSVEFSSGKEKTVAVDNISFSLNEGETLGIVGETGSGKSVTALSVMRLVSQAGKISSGEIIFSENGTPVNLLSLRENEMQHYRGSRIAMIFQEPMTSLNPVFTCGFQVAEALMQHRKISKTEAKKKTISLFEEVNLPDPENFFYKYPHETSGGQRQRVMIAMAISCNPKILIADEPTSSLDVTAQAKILELMKNLQQSHNISMIFISHDLGLIAEIASRVVVLNKGKIVEEGNVDAIFRSPQHFYTKGLLACRPPLDKKLKRLPVIGDFADITSEKRPVEISPEETAGKNIKLRSQPPLLSVKNLKTWFPVRKKLFGKATGYVKAVDDVSFDVFPGETLGIAGESGCGKTTLGRTILRLTEPSSGNVFFRNTELTKLRYNELRKLRSRMQIVFQDPYSSLNPRLTVGEAISEPMKVHHIYERDDERREHIFSLLKKVNMKEEHYYRYPHEFSGGQRQRICIARALALQPEFIVCDEPVSALDVSVQAQVLNLLCDLRDEFNLTCIFISHDFSVVKFISDRIAVMRSGKIEEIGEADEVYGNPKSDYTKRLIDAIPKRVSG